MKIDLNADLGEGSACERALLVWVTSADIACGFHAGSAEMMLASIRWAKAAGTRIGAHPGYNDPAHFGRRALRVAPAIIFAQVLYQIGALKALVNAEGERLWHVKPHGMLYNQAARDPQLADAIAQAVYAADPQLLLIGLAGSELISAGQRYYLTTRAEVFADRRNHSDGHLVSRSDAAAIITNSDDAITQSLGMVRDKQVQSIEGQWRSIEAGTLCLHGDELQAVEFAQALHQAFSQANIKISAD